MSEIRQAQQAITEGFICANCRRQFGGVQELLTHFEKCQDKDGSVETESGLKGFLGKAKQKLKLEQKLFSDSLSQNSSSSQQNNNSGAYGGGGGFSEKVSPTATYFNDFDTAVAVDGVCRSQFDEFRKIRSGRLERYAAESNKLKIRLSKLVTGLEKFPHLMTKSSANFQDSAEWKAHEKSVVSWLDEKPVTRCPECAQGFNLLRRKHHCRLCGSILCHDCSDFIPLPEAFEVIHSERKIREDSASASITFRTCLHCARILRQECLKSPFSSTKGENSESKLLSLYGSIRDKMSEIDKLLPQLVSVVDSIRSGESLYSRDEGNALRSKLLRANEQIDLLSKQVGALQSESGSMIMLQQRIRQSCIAYIREFIRSVPVVPDQADDTSSTSSSLGGASAASLVMTDGWSISAPDYQHHDESEDGGERQPFESENPIQQQIRNVKFYIDQAKSAGKTDEVEMLEASLRDLILWQQSQNS